MRKILLLCLVLLTSVFTFGQIIFTQNFEATWTLPPTLSPAWSGTTTPANNVWHKNSYTTGWTSGTTAAYAPTGANGTTASARFHTYYANAGTTGDFITPVMNFSAYTAGQVAVKFYYINTDGTDVVDVYSSDNGGTTWSGSLMTLTTTATWQEFFVFLPGNSATTKIKFTATSDYGYTDIGIDEVRVLKPTTPAPPISFTVTGVTSGGMTIGWTDNSTNEVGFRVYRSTDGITYTQNGADIISTTVGTTGTLYSQAQTGLWANLTYYYKVVAYADLESSILAGSRATLPPTPICGTKTVGASGADYVNLSTAIDDLKGHSLTCPLTFLLNSDYSSAAETWPIVIQVIPGSSPTNTITIKPNTGITASLSGSMTAGALIKILNSNVIIDGSNSAGGTTRDLTITNTSATTPNVVLIGSTGTTPITNITIKNTVLINGVNTSNAVSLGSSTTIGATGYFNNITFQNNSIQKALIGIFCSAVDVTGNGTGLLITGNDMNTAGANSIRDEGVYVKGVQDVTISSNNIGNIANANAENVAGIWIADGIHNATISGNNISAISLTSNNAGVVLAGIYVNTIIAPASISITGNTIQTLANTGNAGGFAGIISYSPNTNITNNTVSGLTQNGNTAATNAFWGILQIYGANSSISGNTVSGLTTSRASSIATGIEVQSLSSGIVIERNTISNIKSTNANSTAIGLALNSTATLSNINAYNNLIYDVASAGFNSLSTRNGYGITIGSGNGYNLYHNTVRLSTNQTLATGLPACLMIASTATVLDIRNNIFFIDATIGTNRFAIICNADISAFSKIDYNDYFSSGTNLGYIVSNRATLADIQTGFGGNNNSQNINPVFVGTDLHPTNTALANDGFYLASVPTDFSGATRPSPPDLGGYQFSPNQAVTTVTATNRTCTTVTLNGLVNANNLNILSGFEYGLTTAYGNSVSAGTITGNTPTAISADLTGLTINNTYHYRANGNSGSTVIYGSDLTFSTAVPPVVATVAALPVLPTSATLNGTVNPKNGTTTVSFEYGLTTAYGLIANIAGTLTGNTVQNFNATIAGLAINTTYHYRAKAESPAGTVTGSDMNFYTNCVIPPPSGTITGPAAVCKNGSGYVFSVALIPNGFLYNWTFPAGFTITSFPHSNIIMVSVSSAAVSGIVSVQAVSDCGAPGTPSNTTITVNNQPVPTISSGASLVCQSTNNTYTTQAGKSSYGWSVTPDGTISATGNPEVVTISWTATGSKTVGVVYSDPVTGCPAAAPGTLAVTVAAAPVPAITGLNSMCINSGFYEYTTATGNTSYSWTVSSGGTITSGQGTAIAQVVWNAPGPQWVAVNFNNASNCSALVPTVYNVNVNAMPEPAGSVSGSQSVCFGSSGISYSVPPITNAVTYIWSLPAGATISSGAGTNSILVNYSQSAQSGAITVYGNSLCGNGAASAPFNVTVTQLPVAAGLVSGTDSVCAGEQGVAFSVDPVTNATGYVWSLPAGANIASGDNTPQITVDFNMGAVSGGISAHGTNQCGVGVESPAFPVSIKLLPHTPVIYAGGDTLFSDVTDGNQWYYEGSPILTGTGQTLVAYYTGWYWDRVFLNGCGSDTSNNIHMVITGINEPASSSFVVYPVPSNGAFTLKMNTPEAESFDISISNNLGVVVFTRKNVQVRGPADLLIDLGLVSSGVYTMVIHNANYRVIRKILVNR